MSSRKPKIYYVAKNGLKIELKPFSPASFYVEEQIRNEIATEFRLPKDMLFPTETLALTDKSKMQGSMEICLEEKNPMT